MPDTGGALIDQQPEESFEVTAQAPTVIEADRVAWAALQSVLGDDPVAAWKLVRMNHAYEVPGMLTFTATFARDLDVPVPESPRAASAKARPDRKEEEGG